MPTTTFTSSRRPSRAYGATLATFQTEPWAFEVTGLVSKPGTYDLEEVMRKMPLEERVCRFRCVERWAAVIPWSGFPFRSFLELVEPQPRAKYVAMYTANRPDEMPGIRSQSWYPWPYHDGLSIEEANNELAFLVTGSYGKPNPKQNGAPIRFITPWKFGFKQVKSIVKFDFVERQPTHLLERFAAQRIRVLGQHQSKGPTPALVASEGMVDQQRRRLRYADLQRVRRVGG